MYNIPKAEKAGVEPMKMIMAIIQHEDEQDTIGELNQNNFFVTKLSTTGDF